ncbi:hypothetical protein [Bacillus sp. MRMR6]|uniref:hypothetical protein n=1 Tax=Bacillus sp. MRMR6 TaxID=1928617 RepID=UPI0009534C76|nr:hypothetical protein [Bacillus sp. MRMR6]OLS37733.1 hypothetical protein BTR25_15565 [Bacillus sp. MRMR6]
MEELIKLTPNDLRYIEINQDESIELIKKYAIQYAGKEHYNLLGASCVMSAVNTVDIIIGSSEYLNGKFVMPDQIHVERLVDWFLKNRDFDCDRSIITFFMSNYIKRKINGLYRSIKKNELATTLTILGHKEAIKEFKKQIKLRSKQGVKIIRQD